MKIFIEKKKTILVSVLCVLLLITGGFVYSLYQEIKESVEKTYKEVDSKKVRALSPDVSQKESFNLLILGIGLNELSNNEHKYADSINLLSVSPEKKQTIELSIPSYLNIKTQDGENENIASFYSKGGTALEINTIQDFLDCPIDYYIEIDMAGVEQVVDIIGGIEINNHIEFTYQGTHFPIGKQQLNGEDTMKYIKMLAQDPHKEIGRAKREREVITGILDKGLSFKTLAKYKDILEVVSKHMKTNLSFNELYDIQVNYKIAANNVKQIQVQTKNEEVDGKVIQVPEQNEIAKLSEMLKNN